MKRKIWTIDCEANGLLDKATKIHCVCIMNNETEEIISFTNYSLIKDWFDENKEDWMVMHNGVIYDVTLLEKILKINLSHLKIIDTLALSWTLSPNRNTHGLADYGVEYGIPKPIIEDWENDTKENYIHRCKEDVKINKKVWDYFYWYLGKLYDGDEDQIFRYIEYLGFKLDCVKEHLALGVKLDVELCEKSLAELEALKEDKYEILKSVMPKRGIKGKKGPPKAIYKANGDVSATGQKWFDFLKENELPLEHTGEVEYISGYEEPNPNSHTQIKDWLFGLGWEPGWYKYNKIEGSREMKKIPQVKHKEEAGEVCESIEALYEKEPNLEELAGYTVISHRITVFKAFLEKQVNGRVYQEIGGLTNTLRLQHSKPIANLPASTKPFSENIRKALIPDDGMIMIGCDLQGIEDNTKRHYIYKYDPAYVEEMSIPGYDPHLELGLLAGFLKQEEIDFYKNYEKNKENKKFSPEEKAEFKRIKDIRHKSKTTNFSATYKVGAPKLSRESGLSLKDAKRLLEIYWERNKAITKVEDSLTVKEIGGQKWILNPVSGFWYSLRNEKDRFSTLNQGEYCPSY